jgi:hypothetical protein
MSHALDAKPDLSDFTLTRSVDAGGPASIVPESIAIDETGTVVTLGVPLLPITATAHHVTYSVSYQDRAAIDSNQFTVVLENTGSVTYAPTVIQLPASIVSDMTITDSGDYVFANAPDDVTSLMPGAVFIIPASQEFAGAALKVVSLTQDWQGNTVVTTTAPEAKDVVQAFDIDVQALITSADFTPEPGFSISGSAVMDAEDDDQSDDITMSFTNAGSLEITGRITLQNPVVTAKLSGSFADGFDPGSMFMLNMGELIEVTYTGVISTAAHASIPIPMAHFSIPIGTTSLFLKGELSLEFSADGSATVVCTSNGEITQSLGFKSKCFNINTVASIGVGNVTPFSLESLSGQMMCSLTLHPDLYVEIFNLDSLKLVALNNSFGLSAQVSGTFSDTRKIDNVTLSLVFSSELSSPLIPKIPIINLVDWSYPLYHHEHNDLNVSFYMPSMASLAPKYIRALSGVPYCLIATTSGGTPPYQYNLEDGATLPPGMTFSSDGILSGTLTVPDGFSYVNHEIRLIVTDADGNTGSLLSELTVYQNNGLTKFDDSYSTMLPSYGWMTIIMPAGFSQSNWSPTNKVAGYSGAQTSLTLPSSVQSIQSYDPPRTQILPVDYFVNISDPRLMHVSVSNGIIGCYLQGQTSLLSADLPASTESYSFEGCTSLSNVHISDGATTISGDAFQGCTKIEDISIPNSVTTIGADAFLWCTGLTDINIPDSVTAIDHTAFGYCTSLTHIDIPGSVANIPYNAFTKCISLSDVDIHEGIKTIGPAYYAYCFSGCTNLTNITIPSSVTSIGSYAFHNCYNLQSAYFLGDAPACTSNPFANVGSRFTIYYQAGTTGWSAPVWQSYRMVALNPDGSINQTAIGLHISSASKNNSQISVGIDISNNGQEKQATLITGVFDSGGRLVGVNSQLVTVRTGKTCQYITVLCPNQVSEQKVKVFLIDSSQSAPMAANAEAVVT